MRSILSVASVCVGLTGASAFFVAPVNKNFGAAQCARRMSTRSMATQMVSQDELKKQVSQGEWREERVVVVLCYASLFMLITSFYINVPSYPYIP